VPKAPGAFFFGMLADASSNMFRAEDLRKAEGLARVRCFGNRPQPPQRRHEEESQRGSSLNYCIRSQLALTEQIRLILPQLVWAESIRRTFEIVRQVFDRFDVGAYSTRTTRTRSVCRFGFVQVGMGPVYFDRAAHYSSAIFQRVASSRIQNIPVSNANAMEQVITSYIVQGFILVNKTETSATLQKKKEFKLVWAVIGFILCLLPLLIYLIVYATQPEVEVVQIQITGTDVAKS
jgi:hypothetical protein